MNLVYIVYNISYAFDEICLNRNIHIDFCLCWPVALMLFGYINIKISFNISNIYPHDFINNLGYMSEEVEEYIDDEEGRNYKFILS